MVKHKYFWDTGALILYFAEHTQAKSIMVDIVSDIAEGFLSHLVLSEFYYKTQESLGRKIADYRLLILKESKNKAVNIDFDDIHKIGDLKAKNRKFSMVDCVIGTIAKRLHATIVTTDNDFNDIKGVKSIKLEY